MTKFHLFFIALFSLVVSTLYCQDLLNEIVPNAQGIKQGDKLFFEVEGYSVLVQPEDQPYNDHGLFILRNRYFIEKDSKFTTDTSLKTKNRAYTVTSTLTKGIKKNEIYYFLYLSEKQSRLIKFVNAGIRDISLERLFVKAIVNDLIPQETFVSLRVDSLNFAGRKIKTGPICQWMNPHNFKCGRLGQMDWSEYRSLEKAKDFIQMRHDITASEFGIKILEEKEISITFEGIKTKALVTRCKIKMPKLLMGGSNILITYYVSEQVRGKFISCIMSHYEDEAPAGKLPLMLSEIMQLEE